MSETSTRTLLYLDQEMTEPVPIAFAGGEAVVYTIGKPGSDPPNEDAAAVISLGERDGVLVVADGFGGHPAGEEAAAVAMRAIAASVEEAVARDAATEVEQDSGHHARGNPAQDLQAAILSGFDAANAAVLDLGSGAATTLVVVELQGDRIRPYHVGDSEVLVTGQRGRLKLRTVAHSPAGYAVEAGVVDADDALHHEERHLVSNVVGSAEMRIEVGAPLALAPRDTLLVGSDGLFDNLTEDEIVAHIRKGRLLPAVISLAATVRDRMTSPDLRQASKPDDLTIVAYRPTPSATRSRRS